MSGVIPTPAGTGGDAPDAGGAKLPLKPNEITTDSRSPVGEAAQRYDLKTFHSTANSGETMSPISDIEFDDLDDDNDCWECGGEGGWASCMEDCCPVVGGEECCDDPACWRVCPNCRGQ